MSMGLWTPALNQGLIYSSTADIPIIKSEVWNLINTSTGIIIPKIVIDADGTTINIDALMKELGDRITLYEFDLLLKIIQKIEKNQSKTIVEETSVAANKTIKLAATMTVIPLNNTYVLLVVI
tara:strand:- start:159 stop:527 length:369 start_codon:yes stop_codon:yes gene_type:complete